MIRKNKTAICPSLDPKGTLSSILTIKLTYTEPSNKFEPPKKLFFFFFFSQASALTAIAVTMKQTSQGFFLFVSPAIRF